MTEGKSLQWACARVLDLSKIIYDAQKELREILEGTVLRAVADRIVPLSVDSVTECVKRKRGRPPKVRDFSPVTVPLDDGDGDGLAPLRSYRCIDCEKEVHSRQEYLDVVCTRCKGTHVVQTNRLLQPV